MTQKRPRGRPKGSGIKDDRYLDAIADLMVRQPNLKKTPAVSQVVQKAFDQHHWSAAERRLLRKWNNSAEERLEAAQERYAEERRERRGAPPIGISGLISELTKTYGGVAETNSLNLLAREMQERLNPPYLQGLREHAIAMQQLRDSLDIPFLRELREQNEMIRKALNGF